MQTVRWRFYIQELDKLIATYIWPQSVSIVIQCESECQMKVGIGFWVKYENELATADAISNRVAGGIRI